MVGFLAGIAGMLSLTSSKAGPLIGVLISVTTVPAAANIAVAIAYWVPDEAAGSAGQLLLNLAAIVSAGVLTLARPALVLEQEGAGMTDLREALDRLLEAVPPKRLAESTQRLIADYRSGRPADEPLLRNMVDATAYAAYRMPATHAAVAAVLRQLGDTIEPQSLLDVGGGSGAATWAAAGRVPRAWRS